MLRLNEATAYIRIQTTSHPTDVFLNQLNLFLHFNFKIQNSTQNYVLSEKERNLYTKLKIIS